MVLPSDHAIANEPEFVARIRDALETARLGYLTTIGIKPSRAETGYGYIEQGRALAPNAFETKRFVEKPDAARAKEYLESGRFLWNAGMFFYLGSAMMEAIRAHAAEIAVAVDCVVEHPTELDTLFEKMPSISIDHAIMEKASNVAVVPGDFGWNDLGSWQSAWELAAKDASDNAVPLHTVAVDARGNLVWDRTGRKRTYALVGVSDLVVVETEDAVLIVPRSRSQDVRLVVERLKGSKSR
jgi:mannose-1-phosphate guanylyltransferase